MLALNVRENDEFQFNVKMWKPKSEKIEIEAKNSIRQSVGENDIQMLVKFVCLDKMQLDKCALKLFRIFLNSW